MKNMKEFVAVLGILADGKYIRTLYEGDMRGACAYLVLNRVFNDSQYSNIFLIQHCGEGLYHIKLKMSVTKY